MTAPNASPRNATATTDIAFVDCEITAAASVEGQPRRREVVLNGKHVRTVDIHAHCAVPAAMELMGRKADRPGLLDAQLGDRLAAMDVQGIDIEALSINSYW